MVFFASYGQLFMRLSDARQNTQNWHCVKGLLS